jgi:hypothetical protein
VFAYHPHGILPSTASWVTATKEWVDLFPGIWPALLTSSILHIIPFMKVRPSVRPSVRSRHC